MLEYFISLLLSIFLTSVPAGLPTPQAKLVLSPLPQSKILEGGTQVFQTFNNCGPAALSMGLSYYGIQVSQETLGQALRPFQNPRGIDDDKSVTLDEMAVKAESYGLISFHRPNGSIEILKQFINNDIPIITQTLLTSDDDIGHFRVIKGFDDTTKEIIQDDSMQGANIRFSYDDFSGLWEKQNFEYLVLVTEDKQDLLKEILGADFDLKTAWQNSVAANRQLLTQNPGDIYAHLNLSLALYHLGDYKNSIIEFEKVQNQLPEKTLWYQIEPIEAYYQLGDYDKVFELTDRIFQSGNPSYSEAYIIRGNIYKKQGDEQKAKSEYEKALFYNNNLPAARDFPRTFS